ncbi:MAG: hypothetical protein ACO3A4_04865 [Silvanigrellaceae bacterium]
MSWHTESTATLPRTGSGLLFSVRHFLYVVEGRPFTIDVMESTSGHLTAHADSTSDPHEAIHPQSAATLEDVLKAITLEIDAKVRKW